MPTRGYRKGQSDSNEPLPCFLRTRLSEREHQAMLNEAQLRSMTMSKLARAVLSAHIAAQRVQLPHPDRTSALLRELIRVGNNLNQLARQANLGMVAVSGDEIRTCLDRLNALAGSHD